MHCLLARTPTFALMLSPEEQNAWYLKNMKQASMQRTMDQMLVPEIECTSQHLHTRSDIVKEIKRTMLHKMPLFP